MIRRAKNVKYEIASSSSFSKRGFDIFERKVLGYYKQLHVNVFGGLYGKIHLPLIEQFS